MLANFFGFLLLLGAGFIAAPSQLLGVYKLWLEISSFYRDHNDIKGDTMANETIIKEFWEFIKFRRRYWLLPIIIVLGIISLLIVFTEGSAIAPFIYALF